jgi:CBS domain-containing protein
MRSDQRAFPVLEFGHGRLVGVLRRRDIFRWLELQTPAV